MPHCRNGVCRPLLPAISAIAAWGVFFALAGTLPLEAGNRPGESPGTHYYVSPAGDDTHPGTSPELPWRSLEKVNSFPFRPGDVIHFQCGGTWHGQLVPRSGTAEASITYTAYGTGPKPRLLGSIEKNDPACWQPAGENLWTAGPFPVDVGNIIFDAGRVCGRKVWTADQVDAPHEFWYDAQGKLVLLYERENPAELFDDIQCALRRHIINQSGRSYVTYDRLHLAYGAAHGIGGGGTHHITIRNCDLCYIGGGHQFSRKTPRGVRHVRYGNGIEFWNGAHDNLVEGCRIWEIYDAGLTNQGSGRNQQYNIVYRRNIVWNCEYSFEYWNRPSDSATHDIYFEENVCYNAGGGWSHAQRPWPAGVHLMFFHNSAATSRFFVRRNVFHHAENSVMNIRPDHWNGLDGLVMSQNTFVQAADKVLIHWGNKPFSTRQFSEYQRSTGKDADSHLAQLQGIRLEPDRVEMRAGHTLQWKVVAEYSDGTVVEITPLARFTSSAPATASVNDSGLLRAQATGSTSITAAFAGQETIAAVTVR